MTFLERSRAVDQLFAPTTARRRTQFALIRRDFAWSAPGSKQPFDALNADDCYAGQNRRNPLNSYFLLMLEGSVPLIDIHVLEGVFSEDEKAQLITETAKAFGKVAGKTMQDNTSVRVHEVRSGHWGGADSVWTTEKALKLKSEG